MMSLVVGIFHGITPIRLIGKYFYARQMEPTEGTVINTYDAFHNKFPPRWVAL